MIHTEVQLQHGDTISVSKVKWRLVGPNGKTHEIYNDNPVLNSVIYEVEFPDRQIKDYTANVIAENILAHNHLLKFLKQFALQRLAGEISNHLGCQAVFNGQVALFNLVGQEEITNVDSTGSLARAALILLELRLALFSNRIVDLLSWYKMFFLIS